MMTDIRKYIRAVNVFLIMLVLGAFTIHIFLSNYISLLSSVINILVIGIILLILFSTIITYFIFDEKWELFKGKLAERQGRKARRG